jgi:hypothetical protein
MRLRLFGLLLAAAVFPSSAAAAPVVVMNSAGHAVVRNNPYITGPAITPTPASIPAASMPAGARAHTTRARAATAHAAHGAPQIQANATKKKPRAKKKPKPQPTVTSELARLYHAGQIPQSTYQTDLNAWNSALAVERKLKGSRKTELTAVTVTMHNIAAAKQLTPSRLTVLFLTLQRNVQYWKSGPLLSYGQRVQFTGSQLVWEFYPGQGIQLQVLGTFGEADGLYTAGPSEYQALQELLNEMLPLAVTRGGALTWEYYFGFDGGKPPWTSAMSQGTAIEALTRGQESLGADPPPGSTNYFQYAAEALPLFTAAPPTGVGVKTTLGRRYVQYSFASARNDEVINAFLQSLIGLYDFAQASGNATAQTLFEQGNLEAQAELPQFDTGAWSLYQPGQEDTLDYHELVTGFLQQLCTRTQAPIYCTTAQHFQSYLTTPPALTLLTTTLKVKKPGSIQFRLSKISHVGIVVMRGTQTVFSTSASFPYGTHSFAIPAPSHKGQFTIRLAATDLAGNFSRIQGTVNLTS